MAEITITWAEPGSCLVGEALPSHVTYAAGTFAGPLAGDFVDQTQSHPTWTLDAFKLECLAVALMYAGKDIPALAGTLGWTELCDDDKAMWLRVAKAASDRGMI